MSDKMNKNTSIVLILLSFIPSLVKRPPTRNPPQRKIDSGDAFGITAWVIA